MPCCVHEYVSGPPKLQSRLGNSNISKVLSKNFKIVRDFVRLKPQTCLHRISTVFLYVDHKLVTPSPYSFLFAVEVSRGSGEVEPESFGLHGLTVGLPSLVNSLLCKYLIGQSAPP